MNNEEENSTTYTVEVFKFKGTDTISREFWYSSDGYNEAPGDHPAIVHYDQEGRPLALHWMKQGEDHRESGPAWVEIDWSDPEHPLTHLEIWKKHGLCHRLNGPAIIRRDKSSGEIVHEESYIEGEEVNPDSDQENLDNSIDPDPTI